MYFLVYIFTWNFAAIMMIYDLYHGQINLYFVNIVL